MKQLILVDKYDQVCIIIVPERLKIILFTLNETNMNLSFYFVKNKMRVITFFNNNCFKLSLQYKASSIIH